ncbi:MAG: hypothetical protein V3T53_07990 [Phycisphaerales bacterium]
MRMYGTARWQELCRFADPQLARSVATSIASMEFDVRLTGDDRRAQPGFGESTNPATASYVIDVNHSDWGVLADILDEIVDEQLEFDRLFEMPHTSRRRHRVLIIITLTGVVEVLAILSLIEL